MPTESRIFLEALLAGKPDELYLLLWTLPEKKSHWFCSVEDAIRFAEARRGTNLYVGVGLSSKNRGPDLRCKSEDVVALLGVSADLDLRSEAHPRTTLPATFEQALSILPPELPPTFVVSTGNGLQGWWLFREISVFGSDAERNEVAAIANRWQTLLRDNASLHGWTFERLGDLARVLRVAGTTNTKDPAEPKPVTILSQRDRRYNLSDLREYLDDLGVPDHDAEALAAKEWTDRFKDKPITLNLAARIADERIEAWAEADMRFRNSWFRQRHDLRDQTQSGYDLALADFGFKAGLIEQEIVDLLVHHRAMHKQKPRTRIDYFCRTLAKAANHAADINLSPIAAVSPPDIPSTTLTPSDERDLPDATATPSSSPDPARLRIELCRRISAALGVEVLRLVKLPGKEPIYRMELAEGKIEFQNVGKLINQGVVRNELAAKTDKLMRQFKRRDWEQLAQLMLSACLVEQGSEELEYEGAARLNLEQYLAETIFIRSLDGQIPQNKRKPIVRDGRITVCASDFQMYLNKVMQQNVAVRTVAAMLSAIGATTIRLRLKKSKEQSRWVLPLEDFDPSDYSTSEAD